MGENKEAHGQGTSSSPTNPVGDLVARVEAGLVQDAARSEVDLSEEEAPGSDPLAIAICEIATHYGKTATPLSIVSGLSLVNGRLPKEYLADAAARCGLKATTIEIDPLSLSGQELPVIVFTHEGEAEILWRLDLNPEDVPIAAAVSSPGNPVVDLPISELDKVYVEEVLRLVPAKGTDERADQAVSVPAPNWFFAAFAENRRIYSEAIAATVAINILALAMPLFAMNVYDRVLPNAAEATMWALALGVLLATAFDFLLRSLRGHFVDAASRRADVRLSAFIYSRLVGARLAGQPGSTGVKANTLREFETLRDFFNSATLAAFGDLPFLFLFVGVIWVVAGPLAFIVAASIPIVLLSGWITQRALHKLTLAAFQQTSQKSAVAVETLVGMETIKAAGAESWAARKWEGAVAEHVRTGLQIRHTSNLGQHFVHAMQTIVQVVTIIAGFYLVAAGQISMGALIAATILSGRALAPLAQVAMLLGRYNQARLAYQTLGEIVAAPQEREHGAAYIASPNIEGELRFENAGFGYGEDLKPALENFNLKISPGERVAFLGGIGSGKTTALKLAQALHVPQSGRVLLDGLSVTQIDPAVLRRNVGLLLQSAELFHGTIRDNITMGHLGVSDRDLIHATQVSGALDWISRLPQGFDTLLRERGSGLSGGQRQSVALARVLVHRPKVLLLDEPTSDLDGRTEHHVIKSLKAELSERTFIVVTHRPALLELVDRIVVIENGRKIADGPKAEILVKLRQLVSERTSRPMPEKAGVKIAKRS